MGTLSLTRSLTLNLTLPDGLEIHAHTFAHTQPHTQTHEIIIAWNPSTCRAPCVITLPMARHWVSNAFASWLWVCVYVCVLVVSVCVT